MARVIANLVVWPIEEELLWDEWKRKYLAWYHGEKNKKMKAEIREINEEKIWREREWGINMRLLVRNKRWEWGLESGVVWERKKRGSREWEKMKA